MMTRDQEILIFQAVDGSLPAEQLSALGELLSSSDQAVALYCSQSQIQSDIEWLHSVAHNLPEAVTRKNSLIAEHRKSWRKKAAAISLAIAACLTLLAATIFHYSHPKSLNCYSLRGTPSMVYSIQRPSQKNPVPNEAILVGDHIFLHSGTLELDSGLGIHSVIEAPADAVITGKKSIQLNHGVASFHIKSESAKGFTLSTTRSEFVDLGTRFKVIARENQAAELHVIEGQVLPRRVNSTKTFKPLTALNANQAIREDDSSPTGYSPIPNAPTERPNSPDHIYLSFDDFSAEGSLFAFGLQKEGKVSQHLGKHGTAQAVQGIKKNGFQLAGGAYLEINGWNPIHANQPRTVMCWIKTRVIEKSKRMPTMMLVNWGDTSTTARWEMMISKKGWGPAGVLRAGTGSLEGIYGNTLLHDGQWHHLAVVHNPQAAQNLVNSVTLYVDGRAESNSATKDQLVSTGLSNFIRIGQTIRKGYNSSFDGIIDEIHIFRRALNSQEILDYAANP